MPDDNAPQQEPETIGAADVADLVQPLPEVNAAAIDAGREAEAAAAAQPAAGEAPAPAPAAPAPPVAASAAAPAAPPAAGTKPATRSRVAVTDEKGRPFDPLIHECTPDGVPIMRTPPNDRWVRARRQRLKEWKSQSVVADEVPPPEAVPAAPVVDAAKQLAAAQTMCGIQLMAMRVALGDKLGQTTAERDELTASWLAVFQHYGVGGTFHPVIGLALVSTTLVVGSMHHEDTRGRLLRMWHWTQHRALSVWQWMRGKRGAKPPAPVRSVEPAKPDDQVVQPRAAA